MRWNRSSRQRPADSQHHRGDADVQDHVIHFYHLHALDWVDVASALKAEPGKTSQLAQSISEWPSRARSISRAVQDRVKRFIRQPATQPIRFRLLGPSGLSPAPEANLMAVAHYLEALEFQKEFIRIHAVLGGKNPHLQTFLVGGMSTAMDPNEPDATINPERIDFLLEGARAQARLSTRCTSPTSWPWPGFTVIG